MRKTVFVILALVAGIVFAAPPAPVPVKVIRAEFGLFKTNDSGEQLFLPAQVVPHQVGQRYGWIIEVSSARRNDARSSGLARAFRMTSSCAASSDCQRPVPL